MMYCVNFLQCVTFIEKLAPLVSKNSTSNSQGRICVMGSFTTLSMAKGKLDFDSLKKEGPWKLGQNGGYPYSQTKLAQHIYVKHITSKNLVPENVTVNVACPGAVLTNIDGWQTMKKKLGCCFWPIFSLIGGRTPRTGAATFLHMLGASHMEGKTGKFADFGYKTAWLRITKPDDLDFYPSEGKGKTGRGKENNAIMDAAVRERLYKETQEVLAPFLSV
ncbi:hypothetical protein ScalyP_jg128 [Parmales sp. scaly parma]|nr:hypothetical protein ScalyP_jg128 [Parmales sp. scaly parma]